MNPIKQRTPADCRQPGRSKDKGQSNADFIHTQPQAQAAAETAAEIDFLAGPAPLHTCQECAFYEATPSWDRNDRIHWRHVCHFTGRKKPVPGLPDCHFIAGTWDPDRINYLTGKEEEANLGIPNCMRPCGGLPVIPSNRQKAARYITAIQSIAGIFGKELYHIGGAQRLGSGNTQAASYRLGSAKCPAFLF